MSASVRYIACQDLFRGIFESERIGFGTRLGDAYNWWGCRYVRLGRTKPAGIEKKAVRLCGLEETGIRGAPRIEANAGELAEDRPHKQKEP